LVGSLHKHHNTIHNFLIARVNKPQNLNTFDPPTRNKNYSRRGGAVMHVSQCAV